MNYNTKFKTAFLDNKTHTYGIHEHIQFPRAIKGFTSTQSTTELRKKTPNQFH